MLAGVTATWVGNQRLPRLRRLARNTWGPGIGRPLYQNNVSAAPTSARRSTPIHSITPGSCPRSFIIRLPPSRFGAAGSRLRASRYGAAAFLTESSLGERTTFAPEPADCQGISPAVED